MPYNPLDPTDLEGDELDRWYRRSPEEIERQRQAAAAQLSDDFYGDLRPVQFPSTLGPQPPTFPHGVDPGFNGPPGRRALQRDIDPGFSGPPVATRNIQTSTGLSDDMPMDTWQQMRAQQAAGSLLPNLSALPEGDDADQSQATPEASAFNIDRQFITDGEKSRLDMYVPPGSEGHSGPTIGTGVDLGQKDKSYLDSLNITPELKAQLSPYLGRRGESARAFVKANPLVLSAGDAKTLSSAVQDKEFNALANKFDAASRVGPFNQLPKNTQTAIASLYYQYGTGDPARSTPNYWRQITSGDWDGAHRNLLNFGDAYRTRRRREAERLSNDIQAETLPRPNGN